MASLLHGEFHFFYYEITVGKYPWLKKIIKKSKYLLALY